MHIVGHLLIAAATALLGFVLGLRIGTKERNALREWTAFWIDRAHEIAGDHNVAVCEMAEMEIRATRAENERDALRALLHDAKPAEYEKLYPLIVPRITADTVPSTH